MRADQRIDAILEIARGLTLEQKADAAARLAEEFEPHRIVLLVSEINHTLMRSVVRYAEFMNE